MMCVCLGINQVTSNHMFLLDLLINIIEQIIACELRFEIKVAYLARSFEKPNNRFMLASKSDHHDLVYD